MSFLLVDRITKFVSGKSIEGVKQISASEPYLTSFSNKPVFISSLVGEAVGQLAAWSVMHALDFKKRPVAGIVSKVNIFGDVRIGDTLELKATIDALDDEAVEYHGAAYANGCMVFEIESAVGPMVPMDEMNQELEVRTQFQKIFRPFENEEPALQITEVDAHYLASFESMKALSLVDRFDRLCQLSKEGESIAEKIVSQSAPYFVDHFPLKPVLPLTILLSCKIQLVFHYLKSFYPEDSFKVSAVSKIKMSQFVSPGEVLQAKMKVKQKNDQWLFQFKSFIDQKRVCVCQVEVEKEL